MDTEISKYKILIENASSSKNGTFVGLNLSDKTLDNIEKWLSDNNIKSPLKRDELHITLVLSKEDEFPWYDTEYDPPLIIRQDTYKFKLFGDENNVLVLNFSSDELTRRHNAARKQFDLSWDYPSYEPHISLSYEYDGGSIDKLVLPKFDLEIISEYSEPFKD